MNVCVICIRLNVHTHVPQHVWEGQRKTFRAQGLLLQEVLGIELSVAGPMVSFFTFFLFFREKEKEVGFIYTRLILNLLSSQG